MKWLTGHQPNYLPYSGFFSKILRADGFVIVDHAQFRKKSDHKRNLIHGANGPFMLTLQTSAPYQARINEVFLVEPRRGLDEHWESIENCYGKYPYFEKYGPLLRAVYKNDYAKMTDLNETIIRTLLGIFQADKPIYKSSDVMEDFELKNNDMIIHLCKRLGYNGYISGTKAKDYILEEKFALSGLEHLFNEYRPIAYETPRGPSIPNMCILDPLFSVGPKETVRLLQQHYAK
ncbi:MAG: WbqC family protein [Deltaproteobacteria bacterium]|nr:WbqC family protein [Deltaproteobacteria bacterium]